MKEYKKIINLNNIEESIQEIEVALILIPKKILSFLLDKNINLDEVFEIFDKKNINIDFNNIAECLIELKQEKIIIKHINYFLRENSRILEFKKIIRGTKININLVNDFINDNEDSVIIDITQKSIDYLKKEKVYYFFKLIIEELLKNENKKYSDIEFIAEGDFSKVYGIGSKVIKVGDERRTYNIKNNKLFLKPLYRNIIKTSNRDFYVEITERVDTKGITEEDVYQVYKQLRDDGIYWDDAKKANVGRLLKDNKIYFDGVDSVDKESTGYTNDNFEILPKGSLVLLDVDHLYEADKYFEEWDYDTYFKKDIYESRYRKEKNDESNNRSRGII